MTDTPNTIWPKTQWVNRTRNWLAGDYDPVQLELPGMPKPPKQDDETGARLLPFVLHSMADKDGLVRPGRKRLAAIAGVHPETIRRWLRKLKAKGLLMVPPGLTGHKGKSTTYALTQPDWLIALAEESERGATVVSLTAQRGVTTDPPIDDTPDTKGGHQRTPYKAKGGSPASQRGVTSDPPLKGLEGLKGNAGARELDELTKGLAAGMDAAAPLNEKDDPGCDVHGRDGSDKPCGGCAKYRRRQEQGHDEHQKARQRRQAELEREHSDMVKRELDRAEANRATNIEPGHVARLAAEMAAAEPAEPDNPDPQSEHICTHGRNGRPADARGPKRCQTCRHELTPEQLQQAQDAHIARARAKASA